MIFLLGVTLVCIMTPAKGDSISTVTPVTTQIILDDRKETQQESRRPEYEGGSCHGQEMEALSRP